MNAIGFKKHETSCVCDSALSFTSRSLYSQQNILEDIACGPFRELVGLLLSRESQQAQPWTASNVSCRRKLPWLPFKPTVQCRAKQFGIGTVVVTFGSAQRSDRRV